ncbi:hypothetical protein JXL83_05145 [candidate division WOR-3 bacterium]|nr:hypothetical protein [candidate division WOR-3 bacterium]
MLIFMLLVLLFPLISCSKDNKPLGDPSLLPSDVLANYFIALESEDYESAVSMLSSHTIEVMSDALRDDLNEKKRLVKDDSILNHKIQSLLGLPIEEALVKENSQLIALYIEKLPKYFEFDPNYSIVKEEIIDSTRAFICLLYQNGAEDTVFFEGLNGNWKIDFSCLVELYSFKKQVLENAHTIQLAVEEFLYFADSRGYPLTKEEMNLPEGLINPFNGDTAFLIIKETPDQIEYPALEGYVTYFVRTDSLYYLITAHGKNGIILIELYPMPEIPAEN